MGSGSGTAEPAHGQRGDSSNAAASATSASASSPPPLPPAAPLQRPQEERDREQAGGSSSAAAGLDRKGKNLPSAPAVPSSESSSSSSGGSSPEDADAAASGARPFDSTAVFQQLLREQTAIKEAGGSLAEGTSKKKKPEAQVTSSHAIAELWHNLIKAQAEAPTEGSAHQEQREKNTQQQASPQLPEEHAGCKKRDDCDKIEADRSVPTDLSADSSRFWQSESENATGIARIPSSLDPCRFRL
ncbi:trinucleotide repeat-containing gene 18 protein-like [Triticum dicoccoides]|uniref:trinucleotide repeat-containing gene 18 protein-like n=1 Tax=Triticum dicoccoides TaxID=85692 RepID=UPI00188FE026|nr:trinucleotide repeat-containing gene 18 protein-like [Triticum dicoccoides]